MKLAMVGVFIVGFILGGLLMGDDSKEGFSSLDAKSLIVRYPLGHEENPVHIVHKNMCGG